MSNLLPQPDHQPGSMRAADSDRAVVADLLSAAYAEGRLTRDEHDTRIDQAMTAKTFDDLRHLTADLVPGTTQGRAVGAFSSPAAPIDRTNTRSEAETTFAIFGSVDRRGPWRARRHLSNLTLFGGSKFDFSEATFESDVCELNVFCAFGGVDLRVPEGVNVRNETVAIFGGTEVKHINPQPGAPTIVVKGLVLFGGVEAKGSKRRR